jgi:hypothetical protein
MSAGDVTVDVNTSRPLLAFRLAQWSTLAAIVWKIGPFNQMFYTYVSTPLRQDFFPDVLESAYVLSAIYVCAVVALGIAAMTSRMDQRFVASSIALVAMSLLCVHQGSYNDMTFITAWWTSLWAVWLSSRLHRDEPEMLIRRAAFLSRCIVSMILLGGAVGKWTDEYWSGQVLYEIYFVDRDFWLFNWLRENLSADSLRVAATWYSRKVILIETVCGFGVWLLPARWAAVVAILVFTAIALFSNYYLFSVLLSVIGLSAAGLFVTKVEYGDKPSVNSSQSSVISS